MRKFLLDTNIVSAIANPQGLDHSVLASKLMDVAPEALFISSLTLMELKIGLLMLQKSNRFSSEQKAILTERTQSIIDSVSVLPFDAQSAKCAAQIQADCAQKGFPLQSVDLAIAGQAKAYDMVLVSRDARAFSHLPSHCQWEAWINED